MKKSAKRNTKKTTTKKTAVEKVADQLIERLQEAIASGQKFSWVASWRGGSNLPVNYETGKPYSGRNLLIPNGEYLTYVKYLEIQKTHPEVQMRKGSKAKVVLFFKELEKEDPSDPDNTQKVKVLKHWSVFSLDCFENLPSKFDFERITHEQTALEAIALEKFYKFANEHGITVNVVAGCSQPRYEWRETATGQKDKVIYLTDPSQHESYRDWLSVAYHELAHSSCETFGRHLNLREEEIFAEAASSIACNMFGLQDFSDPTATESHTAYCLGWLGELKKDPEKTAKTLMKCTAEASKFVEVLLDGFDLMEYMNQHE